MYPKGSLMTRPVNNRPIDTISGRRGLPPKASPYWRAIYRGLRVGWLRRPKDAGGRWRGRLALPGNDIREISLGAADDPPAKADGSAVLNFAQAVSAAQTWAEAVKRNPNATFQPQGQRRRRTAAAAGPTVEDAMRAYIEAKRRLGQADRVGEAQTVLDRYMPLPFRTLPISELRSELLNGWLGQLPGNTTSPGGGLSQGRIDKLRGVLRAALRLAKVPEAVVREGLSAAAMPQRDAPATREVIPSTAEVDRLIAAAQAIDADLGLFMTVLEITGTRPSQLARCRRGDLDVATGQLTIPPSRKGRAGARKNGRGVTFPIGDELADRLARQLDHGTDLIFHTAKMEQDFSLIDGQRLATGVISGSIWREVGRIPWDKDQWARKIRRAAQAAGLDPEITLYSLRHHRIIKLIQGEITLREIAGICDTSVAMLERHYSRHIAATAETTAKLSRLLEAEKAAATRPALHLVRTSGGG
jgi:integrase